VLVAEGPTYGGARVAASLLRFRRVYGEEARGEAALHASQSGCPPPGAGAGTVEPEQLPSLRPRRAGAGTRERSAEGGDAGAPDWVTGDGWRPAVWVRGAHSPKTAASGAAVFVVG
jgi:hypothetical protein